jgi:hypothetical protein
MARRALNKQKDFGRVMGENPPFHFMQDGRYFDTGGLEVDRDGKPVGEDDPVAPSGQAAGPVGAPVAGGTQLTPEEEAAAAVAARAKELDAWAGKVLDASLDKILPELPDYNDEQLVAIRRCEQAGKTRVTLIAALDAEEKARADATAAQNGSQVASQLGA